MGNRRGLFVASMRQHFGADQAGDYDYRGEMMGAVVLFRADDRRVVSCRGR